MKNIKTNIKKFGSSFKSYLLFSYIVLTFMGLYSAAIFYAGTKFNAHASADVIVLHQSK